MRILVFGNSHVGAWKDGWDLIASEYPGYILTFFGVPEKIHARYRLRANGRFSPRPNVTEQELARVDGINGATDCRLTDHDLSVWVGLDWHPSVPLGMAALGDPPQPDWTGTRPAYGPGFVDAAIDQACQSVMEDWSATKEMTLRPFAFARPPYAETCRESLHPLYAPWRASAAYPEATEWFLSVYQSRLKHMAGLRGLTVLFPPTDTLAPGCATRAEYLAIGGGVVDPADPGARGDHSHMNAAYGARCIRHLMQTAAAQQEAATA
jgi:hypothetical protein